MPRFEISGIHPALTPYLSNLHVYLRAHAVPAHQAWIHTTQLNRGRYRINWTTGGDESGLLHYALPHQQVRTGLSISGIFLSASRSEQVYARTDC